MQTFDQSLLMLYKKGLITYEEALMTASNPDDFALKVKGVQSTSDLTMEEDDRRRTLSRSSGMSQGKAEPKPTQQSPGREYKTPSKDSDFKIERFGDK